MGKAAGVRQLRADRQGPAQILIDLAHRCQGILDVGESLIHRIALGDQFREERRGNGESTFGLGRKKHWNFIEHVSSFTGGSTYAELRRLFLRQWIKLVFKKHMEKGLQ